MEQLHIMKCLVTFKYSLKSSQAKHTLTSFLPGLVRPTQKSVTSIKADTTRPDQTFSVTHRFPFRRKTNTTSHIIACPCRSVATDPYRPGPGRERAARPSPPGGCSSGGSPASRPAARASRPGPSAPGTRPPWWSSAEETGAQGEGLYLLVPDPLKAAVKTRKTRLPSTRRSLDSRV